MSFQHEAQEGRAVRVVDAAPADTVAASIEMSASGQKGIPVLIAPYESQGRAAGATAPEMSRAFQGFLVLHEDEKDDLETQRKKWFKEMRGWLMVLTTVAASVTYQAGLNPPGGFWQADNDIANDNGKNNHIAGNPVLRDMLWGRYMTFYYFNSTAFVTSLVIMVLLMSERFYHTEAKVMALMFTTFVDLASLVGAYIAGTTRYMSSCVYVIVITCVAFVGVVYIGEVMGEICKFFVRKLPCMRNLVQLKWCPVPAEVARHATQQAEAAAEVRSRRATRNPCSPCCAPSTTSGRRDVGVVI